MRKPTDDFFFLFLSVREKLVCMSQNDQRKRERERDESLSVGIYFPHCTHASFWTDEEEGSHFSCDSRVLPVVASVVCGLFFLVTVL